MNAWALLAILILCGGCRRGPEPAVPAGGSDKARLEAFVRGQQTPSMTPITGVRDQRR